MTLRFSIRAALVALALTASAAAQAQQAPLKVAVLDPDLIVVRMPEYQLVQQQLQVVETQIGMQLRAKQDSAIAVQQDLRAMADSPVVDQAARAQLSQTLQRLLGELENGEANGLRLLADNEFQLLQPLLARISLAIETVAAEQSVDIVMPSRANNAPVLLYASDRVVDMTAPVLRNLGFTIGEDGSVTPPASTPGLDMAAPPAGEAAPDGN